MKLTSRVVCIGIVASLFTFAASAVESTVVRIGARTEVVSAPKYGIDLGVIDQHRKVDCSFAVTNRNWRERKVLGVRGNCACLETDVELKTLARGEALPVKVVFNPAGMEGPVDKLVTLRLEGKEIQYPIKADVRLRLGFRPADLSFGVVPAGMVTRPSPSCHAVDASVPLASVRRAMSASDAMGTIASTKADAMGTIASTVAGYVATNATLELVAPAKPFFNVALSNGVLTAAFREGMRHPGLYSEVWEVKTSDPELPLLKVPVSARVAGGLSVAPRALALPREGRPVSRQVMVRASGDASRSFAVLSAETKPRKWGDVKIVRRPLNGWMIRIDDIDPVAVRQFSKKPYLEIKTDFPDMETFEIPVNVSP